ncbi:MAG: exonuclease SbcCD subunit D [Rhodothermales bacterium]|nr:exonuclease SbcCD subunit D [Rhodothermales bacterium]
MFRFLHLADLHLDTVFASRRDGTRERLRSAVRRALEQSVDFAIVEKLDAVVIAGDLFDNDQLSYATEKFIVGQMERLNDSDIPVIYCTGNHDPGGPTNRASRIDWPSNCHLLDSPDPRLIDLTSRTGFDVSFVGAGHDSPDIRENLASKFPVATSVRPHVGVLHAHIVESTSGSSHKKYAPASKDDLVTKGYAYWALGHIHVRQQISNFRNAWYSGNIQGRTPRESGPKGGLLVTIDKSGLSDVTFCEFGPITWIDVDVELSSDVGHLDQLARLLEASAERNLSAKRAETIVRFILTGASSLSTLLRRPVEVDALEQSMRDVLGILDVQIDSYRVSTPRDPEQYRAEPNVLGEALSFLDEVRQDARAITVDLLGDEAVIDWSDASEEMLDDLLTGISEDIIERMVKDA